MVGTMVLGIFPREQNCGDVFLYVVGCQRILRLEVNPVESATIAAALLHGKNTLVKTSLDELRSAEIDTLLQNVSDENQLVEIDDDLAEELTKLLARAKETQRRPEYALFHIYLDSLARLQAELHCVILSGVEKVKAALVVQDKAHDERFSLPCPLGDALALALYADVPVGIVPALVQRALPTKIVLRDVPEEVRSVVEAILPSPERESQLQKKMDRYNAIPLVTTPSDDTPPKKIEIRLLGSNGAVSDGITTDSPARKTAASEPAIPSDATPSSAISSDATAPGRLEAELPDEELLRIREMAKSVSLDLPAYCRAMCGADVPEKYEDEFLRRLLRRLVPETKVRM